MLLLESRARAGGNIQTERVDGYLLDAGPDSFLRTKPQAVELAKELGVDGSLVTTRPEARRVYVARAGELHLMPAGMVLAVPTRLKPLLATPLNWSRGQAAHLRRALHRSPRGRGRRVDRRLRFTSDW